MIRITSILIFLVASFSLVVNAMDEFAGAAASGAGHTPMISDEVSSVMVGDVRLVSSCQDFSRVPFVMFDAEGTRCKEDCLYVKDLSENSFRVYVAFSKSFDVGLESEAIVLSYDMDLHGFGGTMGLFSTKGARTVDCPDVSLQLPSITNKCMSKSLVNPCASYFCGSKKGAGVKLQHPVVATEVLEEQKRNVLSLYGRLRAKRVSMLDEEKPLGELIRQNEYMHFVEIMMLLTRQTIHPCVTSVHRGLFVDERLDAARKTAGVKALESARDCDLKNNHFAEHFIRFLSNPRPLEIFTFTEPTLSRIAYNSGKMFFCLADSFPGVDNLNLTNLFNCLLVGADITF